MKTLRDRLIAALADIPDLTQSAIAAHVGISRASVSDWFTGATKRLEGTNLVKAAEILKVNPIWLADGKGSRQEKGHATGLALIRSWEHKDDLPPGEYVFIPRLAVHLSAGSGNEQIELELVKEQPQAFRAEWIRQQRLKPAALASMTAHGDSMEPRIYDGDALIVDTSQVDIKDGKVYALWYDGGERVKRLARRPGGGLVIRSDNSAKYADISLTSSEAEHVRVLGRVVLISGGGGL